MTSIRVTSDHTGTVPLNLNGQTHTMRIAADGSAEVPEDYLPLLDDSHVEYEIVALGDEGDEAVEGAGGDSGERTAEPSLLDLSVAKIMEKLPDLSQDEIAALLEAEKAGKTRSTLISALEEALNPPQE